VAWNEGEEGKDCGSSVSIIVGVVEDEQLRWRLL
jgi:hypothetical protein